MSNNPELCVCVSDFISSKSWDDIRLEYDRFLQEGKLLSERTGLKIVEIIDVGNLTLANVLAMTPLLIELLSKGAKYNHTMEIRLRNAPTWSATLWKKIIQAVPSINDKNVVFET